LPQNSRLHLVDYEGAKAAAAGALARNLSCVGAEPIAVTDNLNFGEPRKPIGYWQLASACQGIVAELNTRITGGNVLFIMKPWMPWVTSKPIIRRR
jgi:phosphoribosylformylglycinamidine synthase